MSTQLIRLRGTWERTKTIRGDLTFVRGRFQRHAAERGIENFSFTLSRKLSEPGIARGRFDVTIAVPYTETPLFMGGRVGRPPELQARAKHILSWVLQDLTCRVPKVTVERAEVA